MTTFEFETMEGVPDRAWVGVGDKYSVVIIRTDEGVIVDVWPAGADEPFATLGVCDNDVAVDEEEEVPS